MTPEQTAAYIMSQVACANAEIAAMQAEDRQWTSAGLGTHPGSAYRGVIEKYRIGHDAVLQCFQGIKPITDAELTLMALGMQLRDGLADMLHSKRLKLGDIPDDDIWLVKMLSEMGRLSEQVKK